MPGTDDARTALQRAATLWSDDRGTLYDVVLAACDALAAGLDGESLQMLAAITRQDATGTPDVLADALHELGLEHHPRGSAGGLLAGARIMAADFLAGGATPQELANWFHTTYAHGDHPALDRFLELDDRYDTVQYSAHDTEALLDELITAEATSFLDGCSVGGSSDGCTEEVGTHDR
jgi:hypothetical protein